MSQESGLLMLLLLWVVMCFGLIRQDALQLHCLH
jgi:hypothetical protein